jgi:hypothetical protein
MKGNLSKYLNSRLFLSQLSVILSLLTLLIVILHWVTSPSVKDYDEALSLQQGTSEKIENLKRLMIDNFDGMGRKVNDLGDAQLGDFTEVKDLLDFNRGVSIRGQEEILQTVKEEGRMGRNQTKIFCEIPD